jgi:tRNA G10  N-methylase Trm11
MPIEKNNFNYFNTDISSILKYTGKTNEIFTRMMINVALFSSDFYNEANIKLLDPIAGKGTTLFEGLICGYDVYGIEIGDKTVSEAYQYIKKYLETEKYKHNTKIEKISGENKSFTSSRYIIETAKSKEDFKQENFKTIELIAGNSVYANKYYKKNSFHIIVGDLPYGVQHGNVTNEKQSSLTRNPKELLMSCLPGWRDILMPGGTIVLAWNKFVLSKEEMNSVFEQNKFSVLQNDDYNNFEHRVDQAIKRDIIVAKRFK